MARARATARATASSLPEASPDIIFLVKVVRNTQYSLFDEVQEVGCAYQQARWGIAPMISGKMMAAARS